MEKLSGRYRVRGAALRRTGGDVDRLDITEGASVRSWLEEWVPDVLIHLAAERHPDVYADDPAAADRLNIDATRDLSAACRERSVPILFLSTNYVFDGQAAPYSPGDEPNPLNAYGRSKRAGERIVVAASAANRVLRIPMLYGPSASLDESPVTQIARMLMRARDTGNPVPLDVRQVRYPAYTPDLAGAIVGLMPGFSRQPGPFLHFCPGPGEGMTKKDMGEILAPFVGARPDQAVADTRPPSGAIRPENVRLHCPNLKRLGLLKTTPFRDAAAVVMESIRSAGGID